MMQTGRTERRSHPRVLFNAAGILCLRSVSAATSFKRLLCVSVVFRPDGVGIEDGVGVGG